MGKLQLGRKEFSPEDHLMAAFDFPLRVCAWLAQIKANMWVRNGISLRHQASTYRGVGQRDVSHHRDIFLLQTALVICNPGRVLASVVDRFGMEGWVKGLFELKSEAPWEVPGTVPEDWPAKGEIEFKQYSTRYRPELDLVLKDLNIKIVSVIFGLVVQRPTDVLSEP